MALGKTLGLLAQTKAAQTDYFTDELTGIFAFTVRVRQKFTAHVSVQL